MSTRNTIKGGKICIRNVTGVSVFALRRPRDLTLPASRMGTLYVYMISGAPGTLVQLLVFNYLCTNTWCLVDCRQYSERVIFTLVLNSRLLHISCRGRMVCVVLYV